MMAIYLIGAGILWLMIGERVDMACRDDLIFTGPGFTAVIAGILMLL